MSVGFPKDQAAVNAIVGELAVSVNRNFRRAAQLKTEVDSYNDAALTAVGYSAADITTLRALVADLATLNNIYTGAASLATAKDFRTSLRPVWGVLGDM
ncbi:MAG TPA: hypothetical protein VG497_30650 [Kribbella sp.]|nr:hypothetical protein [Kribbella sp.]